MTVCAELVCADEAHYACRLRAKGVQVSASATPNRRASRPQPVRPMREGSWEKGIAGERRRDGSFMPYLRPGTTSPMSLKEQADRRPQVESAVKRLKTDPNIFKEK